MMFAGEIAAGFGWTVAAMGELNVHEFFDWFLEARRRKVDARKWDIDVRTFIHVSSATRQAVTASLMALDISEDVRRRTAVEILDDRELLLLVGGSLAGPYAAEFSRRNQGDWRGRLRRAGKTEADAVAAFREWNARQMAGMVPARKNRTEEVRRRIPTKRERRLKSDGANQG
jgi:hypothetical protein